MFKDAGEAKDKKKEAEYMNTFRIWLEVFQSLFLRHTSSQSSRTWLSIWLRNGLLWKSTFSEEQLQFTAKAGKNTDNRVLTFTESRPESYIGTFGKTVYPKEFESPLLVTFTCRSHSLLKILHFSYIFPVFSDCFLMEKLGNKYGWSSKYCLSTDKTQEQTDTNTRE